MTTDASDQKPRGRWKRVLLWTLLTGGVVGLVSLATLYFVRRPLATRIVQRQLQAVGGTGVAFRVAALDSGETRVEDVRLERAGARIASAGISYSPTGLLGLRFKEASVLGASVEVRRTPTGWSVPLLDWIAGLQLPPPDPNKPKSFYVELPKANVEATVKLDHYELGEWQLPLTVSAQVSPQKLQAEGKLQVLGNEETVAVDLTPDLTGDVRVQGRIADLAVLHRILQYADVPLPVELLSGGEGAKVTASATLSKGAVTAGEAELTLAGSRCRWRCKEFGVGKLHVVARNTGDDLANWQVESQAEGLGGYGASIPELQVTAAGNQREGTAQLIACRFRYGSISGALAGELSWREGRRLSGSLRVQTLSFGGLEIKDAVLSVEGDAEALDWGLQWHDENGVFGLRSLKLAGRATFGGEPGSTVSGAATLAVGAALAKIGLPDWAGEASLEILAGSSVRLAPAGVVWMGKATVSCPDLAGALGSARFGASGLRLDLTGSGEGAKADVSASLALPKATVGLGDLAVTIAGIGLNVVGQSLSPSELSALARAPLEPLPKGSPASLSVALQADRFQTDLAHVAKASGRDGVFAGEASLSELSTKVAWREGAVSVSAAVAGESRDLVVSPVAGCRVKSPLTFRIKAAGTPGRLAGEGDVVGTGLDFGLGQAHATAGSWQGKVSFAGLSPAGLAALPGRLRQGRKLPEGMTLDTSLQLTQIALDVGQWAGLATKAAVGGQVDVEKVNASLHADERGLSGELLASGTGRKLALDSPTTGKLGGDATFSTQFKGGPRDFSASVDVGLTSPNWQRGGTAVDAKRLRVSASGTNLSPVVVSAWLRDPFAVGGQGGSAKASVSVSLEGGKVAGVADGVSLNASGVHWSPATGWRTSEDVRLRVDKLGMRGLQAKGLTARASLQGADVKVGAALPLVGPGVTAVFDGTGQLAPYPSASGTLTVPEFALSTNQGWVLGLGIFGDLEFAGKVSARADATWRGGDLACQVGFALHEGKVTLPGNSGEIDGLDTSLKLDLLPDLVSRPHQLLRFSRVKIGTLLLTDGRVRFQMDGLRNLFVEQARAGWCGGTLNTYALRFDTAKTNVAAVVYARDVDVGEFIKLFPGVKGTGQGKLYGRLPAFRRDGRYGYGEGFLYSIPGEHGYLQLSDLGALAPTVRAMGSTGQTVADALRDFDYSLFRVDIRPKGHENQGVRVRVLGTKAGQKDARPVDLNVNIGGAVEDALNLALQVGGLKAIFENAGKLQRLLRKLIE